MKVCIFEKFLKVSFVLMAMVLFASVAVFDGEDASALTYSSSHDIQFTFNSVISINLSSPNLVISDLAPGEYSDSNIITVGATTNGSTGFQLSATVGQKNGTDALVNTVSSSNTFANLTSTKATLANFSDNTWGYSYCADSSTNCGTSGSGTWVSGSKGSTTAGYAGLPLDNNDNAAERGNGGVLLLNTSGPEDTVQSVQFKIGAKASSGQASGDYTNTINFYAVANPEPQLGPVACAAGKICYNANSLTAYEGTMGQQDADDSSNVITDGGTVTLLASNFSRSGYGFAGWSDTYDYSGHKYGPQETITVPTGTTTNGLSLYAIWVRSEGSIQNWSGCSGLQQGSVTALTDQRDNDTYAVAKLADGNCWMIENLRLDNTATGNTSGTLAQGYNASFAGLANSEGASLFANTTTANTLYSTDGSTDKTISGSSQGYRFPRYNNVNTPIAATDRPTNPTSNLDTNSTSSAGMYSYGNYYTWAAAIADTTNYSSGSYNTTSICPSGWGLPIDSQSTISKTFGALSVALGGPEGGVGADYRTTPTGAVMSKVFRSYPNNFVYSGSISSSSVGERGDYGHYWSSATTSGPFARSFFFGISGVYQTAGNKYLGKAIRCIAGFNV